MSKPVTEYELKPEELALLQEFDTALNNINAEKQGALRLIARQQKLDGPLDLVGNKIVRRPDPPTAAEVK